MAVLVVWHDVELFAPIGGVTVADEPELLEDVERSVDGRRDRGRVDVAAAIDELAAGDVAVGAGEDLDEGPSLGRPAQSTLAETIPNRRPGDGGDRHAG